MTPLVLGVLACSLVAVLVLVVVALPHLREGEDLFSDEGRARLAASGGRMTSLASSALRRAGDGAEAVRRLAQRDEAAAEDMAPAPVPVRLPEEPSRPLTPAPSSPVTAAASQVPAAPFSPAARPASPARPSAPVSPAARPQSPARPSLGAPLPSGSPAASRPSTSAPSGPARPASRPAQPVMGGVRSTTYRGTGTGDVVSSRSPQWQALADSADPATRAAARVVDLREADGDATARSGSAASGASAQD